MKAKRQRSMHMAAPASHLFSVPRTRMQLLALVPDVVVAVEAVAAWEGSLMQGSLTTSELTG